MGNFHIILTRAQPLPKPLCLFNTSTQTCTYAHTLTDTSQDTWHSNPRSLLGGPANFPDVAAMTYSRGWWSKKLMVIWAPCCSSLSGSTASKKQQCARGRLHPAVLSQPLLLLIASDSEQATAQWDLGQQTCSSYAIYNIWCTNAGQSLHSAVQHMQLDDGTV